MSSKFFNNESGNTLFDKLKGIALGMANFDRFLAVVGFFRSSGYFKLRKQLKDVEESKILVGINIDDIFRRHNKTMLMQEIAKRFIEANGRNTNILVVFPPALRDNWENTFKLFSIYKKAQFITNGNQDWILAYPRHLYNEHKRRKI